MQDWFDLWNGLLAAETIVLGAIKRTESRGAHQRDDFPRTDPGQAQNLITRLEGDALCVETTALVKKPIAVEPLKANT